MFAKACTNQIILRLTLHMNAFLAWHIVKEEMELEKLEELEEPKELKELKELEELEELEE